MPDLLAQTTAYANTMFGPDSGVAAASGTLVIHYLLDTIAFYVEASGKIDVNHPVLNTYLRLLEERDQWLAEPVYQKLNRDQGQLKHG